MLDSGRLVALVLGLWTRWAPFVRITVFDPPKRAARKHFSREVLANEHHIRLDMGYLRPRHVSYGNGGSQISPTSTAPGNKKVLGWGDGWPRRVQTR